MPRRPFFNHQTWENGRNLVQWVEVWFRMRDGRAICLPRITQPESAQALWLHQLGWRLSDQPPPKIYSLQIPNVWETEAPP